MSFSVIPSVLKDVGVIDLQNQPCVYSGWLRKRGKRNAIPGASKLFAWSKRFTVLCDGCVYSFSNERSKSEKGAFTLYGYNYVSRAPDVPLSEAMWAFKIVHAQQEYKTYYLSAASEPDMKEWMKQIKLQMMRANNMELINESAKSQTKCSTFEEIEEDIYKNSESVKHLKNVKSTKLQNEDSDGDEEDSDGDEFYQDVEKARANFKPPTNRPVEPINRRAPSDNINQAPSPLIPPRSAANRPPATPPSQTGNDQELYIYGDDSQIQAAPNHAPSHWIPPRLAANRPPAAPPSQMGHDQELYIYGDESQIQAAPVRSQHPAKVVANTQNNQTAPKPKLNEELYLDGEDVSSPAANVRHWSDSTDHQGGGRGRAPHTRLPSFVQMDVNPESKRMVPPEQNDSDDNPPTFFAPPVPTNQHWAPTQTNQIAPSERQSLVDSAMYLGDSDQASQVINGIAEDGTFLIRQGNEGWVLVVYAKEKTRKYKITCKDRKFYLSDTKQFESIGDLVYNYTQHRLPVGVRLITPFRRHPSYVATS